MQRLIAYVSSALLRFLYQPSGGFELLVENLKVQVVLETISPHLSAAKVILMSVIWALNPRREYKDITLAITKRAVKVVTTISTLIETTSETPQLVKNIAQLEEALREVQIFVRSETQSSIFHRILSGDAICIRRIALEGRLASLVDEFEVHEQAIHCWYTSRRNGYIMHGPGNDGKSRSFTPDSTSITKARFWGGSECHQKWSHLHSATKKSRQAPLMAVHGVLQVDLAKRVPESGQMTMDIGIIQGIRVIAFEDISTDREIHRNLGYRLYSDNSSVKARMVKVYQGLRATERCLEAAKFNKKVIHPSFLHMTGVSPLSSEVPFLIFNGEIERSLEASIAIALSKKDLKVSVMLGLQTVISLSSGLDYLRDIDYPFIFAGLKHFGVFINSEGKIVISFDPYIVDASREEDNYPEQSPSTRVDKPLVIFHGLLQQTFYGASQIHYERGKIERAYPDMFEDDDGLLKNCSEDVNNDSGGEHGVGDPLDSTSALAALSTKPSSENLPKRPPVDGHRRELVWKAENAQDFPLEDILREFQNYFHDLRPAAEPIMHRRRGRYTSRTAHRCPGYNRTEITFTADINRSAIVSHSTPLPHEICQVCKQTVKDAEIFNCICGGEDNESVPTISCSSCSQWHHRPCVLDFEFTNQSFTCRSCRPPISTDDYDTRAEPFGQSRRISRREALVPTIMYRQVFKAHYDESGRYLASYLASTPPDSRSNARAKLTRLTFPQFHELSTDVYDELIRREYEKEVPFLAWREEFHPKRNQLRQKLATFPTTRFKDLAGDVYFETGRRYPEFKVEDHITMKSISSHAPSPPIVPFAGISNYRTEPKGLKDAPAVPTITYRQVFKAHYDEFGRYLATYLASAPPNSRSNARAKLTRLIIQQFHELSTDVYDELIRRKYEKEVPFLAVREEFHPKRNQARQKLATLPTTRFEDISSNVHFELGRRYPEFKINIILPQ